MAITAEPWHRVAEFRFEGEDVTSFLQGQLTQDVDSISMGESKYSLVMDPNGGIVAWVLVRRESESWRLVVEGACANALDARLKRFLLRTRAAWDIKEREYSICAGEGPWALRWPGEEFSLCADESGLSWTEARESRVRAGVPAWGAEVLPDTIPAEAGAWLVEQSVSFTKGCFVGQERLARVHHRGSNVPRRLVRIEPACKPGTYTDEAGKVALTATTQAARQSLGLLARRVDLGAVTLLREGQPVQLDLLEV